MSGAPETPEQHERLFWRFVTERQAIWHRRFVDQAPKPWTQDAILRKTKFTNVYRELDPGTQYVLEHVVADHTTDPAVRAFNALLYRVIGRPETHEAIGMVDPAGYDVPTVIQAMRLPRPPNSKGIFTGAYLVHPYHWMGGQDKVENVALLFAEIAQDWDTTWGRLRQAQGAEAAYGVLRGLRGIGDFLAFQTLVDLQYPREVGGGQVLESSNDEWAKAGPGAIKGLHLVFGDFRGELDKMRTLRDNQDDRFDELSLSFHHWTPEGSPQPLSLANIQNCLCEYHKYAKIQAGTGRGRSSYPGA